MARPSIWVTALMGGQFPRYFFISLIMFSNSSATSGLGSPQVGQASPPAGIFNQNPLTTSETAFTHAKSSFAVTDFPVGLVLIPASNTMPGFAARACSDAFRTYDSEFVQVEFCTLCLDLVYVCALRDASCNLRAQKPIEAIRPSRQVSGRRDDQQAMLRMHDCCNFAGVLAGVSPFLLRRELPLLRVIHHRADALIAAVLQRSCASNGDGSDRVPLRIRLGHQLPDHKRAWSSEVSLLLLHWNR